MRFSAKTLKTAFFNNFQDALWNIIALQPKMFFSEDGNAHYLHPLHATHHA